MRYISQNGNVFAVNDHQYGRLEERVRNAITNDDAAINLADYGNLVAEGVSSLAAQVTAIQLEVGFRKLGLVFVKVAA